jgi:hypothetical protein
MTSRAVTGRWLTIATAAVLALAGCAPSSAPATVTPTEDPAAVVAEIRAREMARLQAMLDGDIAAARGHYADEYELVDPVGDLNTLDAYLQLVESGRLDYVRWEPTDEIVVRVYGDVAAIRYPSVIDVSLDGQTVTGAFWQTELLERRNGTWQLVWGQTTPMR